MVAAIEGLPKEWLDYREAAEYLGVGKSTLYKLYHLGHVKKARVPGTSISRFSRSQLERLMQSRLRSA